MAGGPVATQLQKDAEAMMALLQQIIQAEIKRAQITATPDNKTIFLLPENPEGSQMPVPLNNTQIQIALAIEATWKSGVRTLANGASFN